MIYSSKSITSGYKYVATSSGKLILNLPRQKLGKLVREIRTNDYFEKWQNVSLPATTM